MLVCNLFFHFKIRGPLAPQSDQGTALPLVLLVGNHSSGKSSFINYIVGRPVQTAGVAPTDDCFTILAPGSVDRDQDGPAVVGDPNLGFAPLQQFGPTLVHHTLLKIRKDLQCNFMLGMYVLVLRHQYHILFGSARLVRFTNVRFCRVQWIPRG